MNIHINKPLNNTFLTFEVGSTVYSLNNKNSDIDYLSLFIEDENSLYSYLWEHHQLQYKDKNIDYNYTSLKNFIRNILTGDSTINFECLFTDTMKDNIPFLYENRYKFINYKIIKSYLGLAKRDYKMLSKKLDKHFKHKLNEHEVKDLNRKIVHFLRGVMSVELLMKGEFSLDFKDIFNFNLHPSLVYNCHTILKSIKNNDYISMGLPLDKVILYYKDKMENLRKELNHKLETNQIHRFGDIEFLEELDNEIKGLYSFLIKNNKTQNLDEFKSLFYETLENGVNYDL